MSHKMGTVFNSRWWSIELPLGWQAVEDADCVTLSRNNCSSAFQISAARKGDQPVTDEDLSDFAAQRVGGKTPLRKMDTDRFTGFYAEHIEDGIFWREWWLRAGNLMVYCSYNVEEKLKESESVLVDNIVESLALLPL
jgi:hypothetical protein